MGTNSPRRQPATVLSSLPQRSCSRTFATSEGVEDENAAAEIFPLGLGTKRAGQVAIILAFRGKDRVKVKAGMEFSLKELQDTSWTVAYGSGTLDR